MNKKVPALLASLALGVVALTGCSASAGAAAGDLSNRVPMASNRVPMAQAGQTGTGSDATATVGQVTVTSLSKADFDDQRGEGGCAEYQQVTYCQVLQSHGTGSSAYVDWTAYIGVPQDAVDATMSVGNGFEYTAAIHAQSPYVKVTWNSPDIPSYTSLGTDVRVTLDDGTVYDANCVATFDLGGRYSEEDLSIEPGPTAD